MSPAADDLAAPAPSLTPPPLHAIRTIVHGHARIRVAVDPDIVSPELQELILNGGYEAAEASLATRLVGPTDRVLELGAGLGFIAALLVTERHPAGYVAVEADPRLWPLIAATLGANGAEAARIVVGVLTNDPVKLAAGSVAFAREHHFWGSHEVAADTPGAVRVPAQSLNRMLAGEAITVMIVDVEGGEAALFDGADFSGLRAVFLEMHADRIGSAGFAHVFRTFHAAGLVYDGALSSGYMVTFRRW